MTRDQIEEHWKRFEVEARKSWEKLTDADWKLASGDMKKLIARVQARYGHAEEVVMKQIDKLFDRIDQGARTGMEHVEGRWRQIESEARLLWDRLTEDDWTAIAGDAGKIIEAVQRRYGYARAVAAGQLNALITQIRDNAQAPHQSESNSRAAGTHQSSAR